ncbi:alpha-galactosidase [Sphingomonas sp. AP4-R1]|uniref:alpha-galactosidase n=1 Tax=Sphingomonas sp. AP4-R1 TaxID=2735134 RepID=UPI0020A336FB|nr:alpha-galactosidase [Sphingomonas sp. AP4-R1]
MSNGADLLRMNRRTACGGLLAGLAMGLASAPAISQVLPKVVGKSFRLDSPHATYAFGVNERGQLQSLYWGAPLAAGDPLPPAIAAKELSSNELASTMTPFEFAGFGGGLTTEPALKVTLPDGTRDLELRYVDHRIEAGALIIHLRDITTAIDVHLRYAMDQSTGLVIRSAVVENNTRDWIQVDQLAAGNINLPAAEDYRLHYLAGRWSAEWQLQSRAVTPGSTVIESRRGVTSHQANPWLAIGRDDVAEESGAVWFAALGWSGSWRMTVDRDAIGAVRASAGYNPFDFSYRLRPGETLASPNLYLGFSGDGFGGASRLFHRYQRAEILPGVGHVRPRPVLYNSWEATQFDVTEAGQIALAEKAASIGCERFVMDDGWFGARDSDKAGLGDWTVNRRKFPNGLGPLIRRVKALGMDFGLWVEPEMVNPDSDLYRAHPDWVINFPGRPRTEARQQLVLNLARRDVCDHILTLLDKLLTENDIAFIKWDHNRNWSEPGWPEAAPAEQQKIYVDYVDNLYALIAELRRRHPRVEIESCASGGGRVDLGIMRLTDQVWVSDNTDPYDRMSIQDGFSRAYTPAIMMAWVTDSPNWVNKRSTPLDYRFLSSMQGALGIGANLHHWTAEDFATARAMIAAYKRIRSTVQQGDLYRLLPARKEGDRSATLSVSPDRRQAALFAFTRSTTMRETAMPVTLLGLDPARRYAMTLIAGEVAPGTPAQASGAFWMGRGVDFVMTGDFRGCAVRFDAV